MKNYRQERAFFSFSKTHFIIRIKVVDDNNFLESIFCQRKKMFRDLHAEHDNVGREDVS